MFGQSGCIWAKEVAFGQKWLYSDKLLYSVKSCCTRAKLGLFGQSGCIRQKYSYTTTLSRIQPLFPECTNLFPNTTIFARLKPLLREYNNSPKGNHFCPNTTTFSRIESLLLEYNYFYLSRALFARIQPLLPDYNHFCTKT